MAVERLQEKVWLDSDRVAWGLALLVATIGGASWLSLNARDLGYRFEFLQPYMELDYAVGVLTWVAFALGILIFARDSRRMLLLAWVGKFFVVLVAMLFYEHHYGLDSGDYLNLKLTGQHWYFSGVDFREDLMPTFKAKYDSLGGALESDESDMDFSTTENFLRIFLLLTYFMPSYYHAMKVEFAFLGLMAIWFFYRAIVVALGRPYPLIFYLLAFFPSIIFWSSILGKDPVQFLFLSLYAYGGSVWLVQGRFSAFLFIGVGLLGASFLRPWMAAMAIGTLLIVTMLGRCRKWQVVLASLVLFVPLFWGDMGALFKVEQFVNSPDLVIDQLRSYTEGMAEGVASGGDVVDMSSPEAFGAALPLAIFSGFFRPLPFDITNPFTALAAAENMIVLCLAIMALRRFRVVYLRDPILLWPVLYSFVWASFYGFIVMVNFGSGVRYKLQVWPFLLMAILLLAHRDGRALLESRLPGSRKVVKKSFPEKEEESQMVPRSEATSP